MKRIILPILILATCIGFSTFIMRNPKRLTETAVDIIPVTVRVTEVKSSSTRLLVGSQGKVQAARTANLAAATAGPVAWISPAMQAGGFVKGGDTLLKLETSDYETIRARSEATMRQAQAEWQHAAREYKRMQELADQRLASQSQLQDAQRLAEVSSARLAGAEANNKQAILDLGRAEIKAPFDAIINSRDVELGQYVNLSLIHI